MPIKSQAQRRKFAELLVEGKISPEVYERWNRGAGYKKLPEHVKPKAKSKSKRTSKETPKKDDLEDQGQGEDLGPQDHQALASLIRRPDLTECERSRPTG